MQLTADTATSYLHHAFEQMLAVADRVGDPDVNERPHGPTTNAIASLIVHCCGVAEFWLGHVGLARPDHRDRDAEFGTTATVAELHELVARAGAQAAADIEALQAGQGTDPDDARSARQLLVDSDGSDASLVLHVLEELYQHLGHMELTADALAGR